MFAIETFVCTSFSIVALSRSHAEQQGHTVVDAATHSTTCTPCHLRHCSSRGCDRRFERTRHFLLIPDSNIVLAFQGLTTCARTCTRRLEEGQYLNELVSLMTTANCTLCDMTIELTSNIICTCMFLKASTCTLHLLWSQYWIMYPPIRK